MGPCGGRRWAGAAPQRGGCTRSRHRPEPAGPGGVAKSTGEGRRACGSGLHVEALQHLLQGFVVAVELQALAPDDPEELLLVDYAQLKSTPLWQVLDRHVRQGQPWTGDPALAGLLEQGRRYWQQLANDQELHGYFQALQGRHIASSYGGDPIKNPDSLPTGRNLYGFDPSRIPTREAWQAGQLAAQRLLDQAKAEGLAP